MIGGGVTMAAGGCVMIGGFTAVAPTSEINKVLLKIKMLIRRKQRILKLILLPVNKVIIPH